MLLFIVKRVLWMIPSLFAVSFLAFVLIQLPPGDFVTNYIATRHHRGEDCRGYLSRSGSAH